MLTPDVGGWSSPILSEVRRLRGGSWETSRLGGVATADHHDTTGQEPPPPALRRCMRVPPPTTSEPWAFSGAGAPCGTPRSWDFLRSRASFIRALRSSLL